jgi:hypothetical protein
MREGATGNKNFLELGGKMFAARKGLRSQRTPASHEQGRLVVVICWAVPKLQQGRSHPQTAHVAW